MDERTTLLQAVRDAADRMDEAVRARAQARVDRGAAIQAAEAAGISREDIAEAAKVKWPQSRTRWSKLRRGVSD